jgi:hypothetical protein
MVIAGNRIWNEMFAANWMRDRMRGSASMTGDFPAVATER